MEHALGAISKRIDAMKSGGRADDAGNGDLSARMSRIEAALNKLVSNGASDNGNGDAATGEEGVSYSGETNEEEKGHSTIGTGEDTSFNGTRARQLASDSAGRSDSRRMREEEPSEEDRIGALRAGLDDAYMAIKGEYAPRSYADEVAPRIFGQGVAAVETLQRPLARRRSGQVGGRCLGCCREADPRRCDPHWQ